MSKSGAKKCPRCRGEMNEAHEIFGYAAVTIATKAPYAMDKIVPFYCKNCGYIELYKMKELTDSISKDAKP
jgi:predicted nucleic-acid-binding Zn-ribbon protein